MPRHKESLAGKPGLKKCCVEYGCLVFFLLLTLVLCSMVQTFALVEKLGVHGFRLFL